MKVIFLDIDGVLNTGASTIFNIRHELKKQPRDDQPFDVMACSNLNYLLERFPKAEIVISSTWRKSRSLSELRKIFEDNGIDPLRIAGVTPVRNSRGEEIAEYCKTLEIDMKETVAIDDATISETYEGYFHQVYSYNGLTMIDTCEILEKFGEKPPMMFF
jgi:phosphoglycolate phosphatase-like HAD superfamily hydrolase